MPSMLPGEYGDPPENGRSAFSPPSRDAIAVFPPSMDAIAGRSPLMHDPVQSAHASLAVLGASRCALHLGVLIGPGGVAHVRGVRRLGVALRSVVGDVARRRDRHVQGSLHEDGDGGEVWRRDVRWRVAERMQVGA